MQLRFVLLNYVPVLSCLLFRPEMTLFLSLTGRYSPTTTRLLFLHCPCKNLSHYHERVL